MNFRWCLLAVVMSLASCSKHDEAPKPLSLQETLTWANWNLRKLTLFFADGSSVDLTNITFRPCELDDVLSFGKDGVFRKTEGTNVCNPIGGSVFNNLNGGSWAVQDSTLVIAAGFNVQTYKVSSWSSSSLTWKQSQTNYLGEKEEYVYEVKAQ